MSIDKIPIIKEKFEPKVQLQSQSKQRYEKQIKLFSYKKTFQKDLKNSIDK